MADPELAKEFLRDAFNKGALDLGADRKFLEGFIRLFAGELEALIAVQSATYLEPEEQRKLVDLAEPTKESLAHLRRWLERI